MAGHHLTLGGEAWEHPAAVQLSRRGDQVERTRGSVVARVLAQNRWASHQVADGGLPSGRPEPRSAIILSRGPFLVADGGHTRYSRGVDVPAIPCQRSVGLRQSSTFLGAFRQVSPHRGRQLRGVVVDYQRICRVGHPLLGRVPARQLRHRGVEPGDELPVGLAAFSPHVADATKARTVMGKCPM